MSIDNLRHAQYDQGGVQIDDPQELTRGISGWQLEGTFTDLTTQSGSPIDTPKTILLGAGGVSSSGIISVDAAGIVTALKTGTVGVKARARVGRSGAAGVSNVFLWTEISANSGATWSVLGNSASVTLNQAAESQIFFDFSLIALVAGLKLRQRFARSSTGNDSGDLIPVTPSAALQTAGVPITPSAQLTVYRYTGFNYV